MHTYTHTSNFNIASDSNEQNLFYLKSFVNSSFNVLPLFIFVLNLHCTGFVLNVNLTCIGFNNYAFNCFINETLLCYLY